MTTSSIAPLGRPDPAALLRHIRARGVRVWADGGQLRYRAWKGALRHEDIEQLGRVREQVLQLLTQTAARSESKGLAPLSFSQRAHWNLHRLSERQAMRQVGAALRLHGPLNQSAMHAALNAVVRHHDALRARIVVVAGEPMQEITGAADGPLQVERLRGTPESELHDRIVDIMERLILGPVNVESDPLCEVRLIEISDQEHVLAVAMEHMISDAVSMNVFLRDLSAAYEQLDRGSAIHLPAVQLQLPDFATWQASSADAWLATHGTYWKNHLEGCGRVRFPDDVNRGTEEELGWEITHFSIGKELKQELKAFARQHQTTMVMSAFTAYIALVLRWCGTDDSVVLYQTDGRTNPKLENTMGYVAALLYLRIRIRGDETLRELMNIVSTEFYQASLHADAGYLEAQTPRPEFTRNGCFNWVPQFGTEITTAGHSGTLSWRPIRFKSPMRKRTAKDCEPAIVLFDRADEIFGGVYFPLHRFSVQSMERLARNLVAFVEYLVRAPATRVCDLPLV